MTEECVRLDGHPLMLCTQGEGGPVIYWGTACGQEAMIREAASLLSERTPGLSWTLAAYGMPRWNHDYSPWPSPAVFRGESFTGGARDTLDWLRQVLIPYAEGTRGMGGGMRMTAGYSLSGLFSLYAVYECALFDGSAACSPSLWYPGWEAYMNGRTPAKPCAVYLSLGRTEERTRNRTMAAVGDAVRAQAQRLAGCPMVKRSELVWHPGGHFAQNELRMAHGLAWLVRHAACREDAEESTNKEGIL